MKYIIGFILIIFGSCNSNNNNLLMKTKLFIHNENAALKYKREANKTEGNYRIKYKGQPDYAKLIDLEMESFRLGWNNPYDIQKDSTLTYEKYKKYCKAHGYDEDTYIDYIDEKK